MLVEIKWKFAFNFVAVVGMRNLYKNILIPYLYLTRNCKEMQKQSKYFFLVYSCKKYLKKSNLIYDIVSQNLSDYFIPLVIYGEPGLGNGNENLYEVQSERYLVLNCCDYYEGLSEKTMKMVLSYSSLKSRYENLGKGNGNEIEIKGLIKCDDDILPNIQHLKQIYHYLQDNPMVDYCGKVCQVPNSNSNHHFGKCSDPKFDTLQFIPTCYYATGPMYFLGNLVIFNLQNLFLQNSFEKCFYEDIMIGCNMQCPVISYPTYVNDFQSQHRACFQNVDNKIRNLYVVIHGGLGNQLFQIASAFGLAQKHGYYLTVLSLNQPGRYGHQKTLDEYIRTIFNRFPCIRFKKEFMDESHKYSEIDTDNNCFEYSTKLASKLSTKRDKDWLMYGYFQNEKYFLEYRDMLVDMFWQSGVCEDLKKRFEGVVGMENAYFLHIRRGDYVGNALYAMDNDTYYRTAIAKVLEKDSGAHFYVLSNDMAFCRNYGVLEGLRFTFMDGERELDTLESLFFMAMCCSKGGICANSSFSWWGSWLNKNGEKLVIMPKQWMKKDGVMDVYPRGAILV